MDSSKVRDESKKILEPILRSQPVHLVLDSMIRAASNCKDSRSQVLSFVLENYSFLRLIPNSVETLRRIRVLGCVPSTVSCNELLDALCWSNRFELGWVCYAVLVRAGFQHDGHSWSVLCKIICGQAKVKRAEMLLDLGVCGVSSYDLVIDSYCEKGDFRAAMWVLNQMYEKSLSPCFGVYVSFLDGGCKFGDVGVINLILKEMIVRGLLATVPDLDYDLVINRICELQKTFAAEMFFGKARNVNFKLGKGVYASLLQALAKEGRVKEAMQVYRIMLQGGINMDRSCGDAFLSGMCRGEPSEEVDSTLKILVGKGFVPSVDDLSMYIGAQCDKNRWAEASDILNIVLDKGFLLDAFSCCSLVKHYCANGLLDSAIKLHEKLKNSGGCLDVNSYNALLEALFLEKRVADARQVFGYMEEKNVLSSASFVIMIRSLCQEKELRKAMNLHDEMLRLGLKPNFATYKHLISGFA